MPDDSHIAMHYTVDYDTFTAAMKAVISTGSKSYTTYGLNIRTICNNYFSTRHFVLYSS